MTNIDIKKLLARYQNAEANLQEQRALEDWYAKESFWQMQQPEMEDYSRIKDEIWIKLELEMPVQPRRLWSKMWLAAAVLIGAIFGIWFFTTEGYNTQNQNRTAILYSSDVAPGKNGATIKLSDGRIIPLDSAHHLVQVSGDQLSYGNGSLAGTGLGEELLASTERGQTYCFTLQDGTKVWLNAASSLKFPTQFSENQRIVEISGEGYFEVAKDAERPFIVKSSMQEIRVLGTHFNINTYLDEPLTKTSLVEGSVEVLTKAGQLKRLIPGQQSLASEKSIKLVAADIDAEISWVKGDFVFKLETLDHIMKEVARWYNVEIKYQDGVDQNMVLGGLVSRSKNISEVLKMMELTKMVRFKIDGRTIIVMP